jgi:hypothetical protein
MIVSMIRNREGGAHFGSFAMMLPQEAMPVNNRNNPRLTNPRMTSEGFAIPIPVSFYKNICSQTYWDVHVKKFGGVGGLKIPQIISAAVSSRKRNLTSNGYHWEWHVLKEYDVNLKQALEVASLKCLSVMTPAQRKEHAEIMRRDMVANFQALLAQRDKSVEQTISAGEFTTKIDQKDLNYVYGIKPLLDRLRELFETHCKIISHIPKVEVGAGQQMEEVRNSVLNFYKILS